MAQSWRVTRWRHPDGDRTPRPLLTADALEALALRYVGRYATTRARLRTYLMRKLVERGWDGDEAARARAVDAVVQRHADLGYVDDRAVAEAKSRALAARGLGARRVRQALAGLGVEAEDAAPAQEAAEGMAWETALRFARRRRLGPFAPQPADPAARRRAFAAMVRGGHSVDHIRRILDAPVDVVPEWDEP